MNRRPGETRVTTEVGYCNFCGRSRNLRREEHVLGTLVRTIVTCESCHRTLSSSMSVAATEAEAAEPVAAPPEPPAPAPAPEAAKPAARKRTPKAAARAAPAQKPAAKKPAATPKTAAKKAPGGGKTKVSARAKKKA